MPIETYFRKLRNKLETSGGDKSSEKLSSSLLISSPKRKLLPSSSSFISVQPSPGRERKLNFQANLSFWQNLEGGGGMHIENGQTNTALRMNCESEKTKNSHKENNLEVVIWRDYSETGNGLPGGQHGTINLQHGRRDASVSELLLD